VRANDSRFPQTLAALHAKVYIGEKGVIISSANASANGLGEEGDELLAGLEVGYFTTRQNDLELARRWFDDKSWLPGHRG
jgi:hypothetical protein